MSFNVEEEVKEETEKAVCFDLPKGIQPGQEWKRKLITLWNNAEDSRKRKSVNHFRGHIK